MSTCGSDNCDQLLVLVTDGPRCYACKKDFHFDCAWISKSAYCRMSQAKITWCCPKCNLTSGGTSGIALAEDPEFKDICEVASSAIGDLTNNIQQLHILSKDFEEMEGPERTDMTSSLAQSQLKLNDLFSNIWLLDQSMTEEAHNTSTGYEEFHSKISAGSYLDRKFSSEHWARMVQIKNIPESKKENLYDIVFAICIIIKYAVKDTDIKYILRMPAKKGDNAKPIVVEFINRYVKADFVALARSAIAKTPIRLMDLGFHGTKEIYINDYFTTKNKKLLIKAKRLANEPAPE